MFLFDMKYKMTHIQNAQVQKLECKYVKSTKTAEYEQMDRLVPVNCLQECFYKTKTTGMLHKTTEKSEVIKYPCCVSMGT